MEFSPSFFLSSVLFLMSLQQVSRICISRTLALCVGGNSFSLFSLNIHRKKRLQEGSVNT